MKLRVGLVIGLLMILALACSLSEDETESPTLRPALPTADLTIVAQANSTGTALANARTTPTGTATSSSSTGNNNTGNTNPNCTPRTDWPTMIVASGDTLSGIAERTGSTVDTLVSANCLVNADAIFAGQQLRVPTVPIQPTAYIPPGCSISFFFTFESGKGDPSGVCPNPAVLVAATGQDFEGGRVYRYAPPPGSADPRGTIYVIYNSGYWETVIDTWDASQPFSDPNLIPPAGRVQPTGPIGKMWRENLAIQQQLGWAYTPEAAFAGRIQTMPVTGATNYFYIDHGNGLVLRLYPLNMAPNTWERVGAY